MSSNLFRRAGFAAPSSVRTFCRMTLIGRIARPAEVVPTSNGDIVKFTVVTSHGKKPDAPASFWDVASFEQGPRRDFLLSLPQSSLICLEADAQKRQYETKEGEKRYGVNLTHRNLEVLYRPRPREDSQAEAKEEALEPEGTA